MRRYLRAVPDATPEEIAELKAWVEAGNDPYLNPLHLADDLGRETPFIHALRVERDLHDIEESDLAATSLTVVDFKPF